MRIDTLGPGGVYRVAQRFTDCRGGVHEPGETFTYHSTSYWGYDGGVMLNCAQRRIDFLELENAALIANFASHIEKIGQTKPPRPRSKRRLSPHRGCGGRLPVRFFW